MRNDLGIPAFSRTVADSSGVARRRVVVRNTSTSDSTHILVKNPAAANGGQIVGITRDAAADKRQVGCTEYGYEECEAASAIAIGDTVNIADTAGRVKTVSEAATTLINVVGVAEQTASASGDIIMVNLKRLGTTYVA